MSDKPISTPPGQVLDNAQVESVSGGLDCTGEQIVSLVNNLTRAYEGLIDFTSHVIERVSN